jgi:hypothetical protein
MTETSERVALRELLSAVVDYQCAIGYASNCLNEERAAARQQLRAARNILSTAMRRAESMLG